MLKTHDVKFVVTAPYLAQFKHPADNPPNPYFSPENSSKFFSRHGVGVSAVGVEVVDAKEAYKISVENGAKGLCSPFSYVSN